MSPEMIPSVSPEEKKEHPADEREETSPEAPEAVSEKKREDTPETRLRTGFSKFNIKEDELNTIEGYGDLSAGQKELALLNLEQITLGRVQEEAIDKSRNEIAEAGFAKKIWRGYFKGYYTAKTEKETTKQIMEGGMKEHGELLKDIIQRTKESGVDAQRGEDGKLQLFFTSSVVDKLADRGDLGEHSEDLDAFDSAANELMNEGIEWEYGRKGDKNEKRAEAAREKYEVTRGVLLERLSESFGGDEATKIVYEMDTKVRMHQFLNANPDAEKELEKIESQNVWRKAFNNVVGEKGLYMGMGWATRTITTNLLGAVAAPLAAAGMGAWVARRRAIQQLQEDAMLVRGGKVETAAAPKLDWEKMKREKASEFFRKSKELEKAKTQGEKDKASNELEIIKTQLAALTQKVEEDQKKETPEKVPESTESDSKPEKPRETVLNVAKAENLKDRINFYIGKIGKIDAQIEELDPADKGTDIKLEEERKDLVDTLKIRLNYTEAKIQGGLINYGDTNQSLGMKYSLADALSHANMVMVGEEPEIKQELEERLGRYLGFKEKKISKKVHKQMLVGAGIGAGFAGLGYGLAWIREVWHGGGSTATELVQNHGGGGSQTTMEENSGQSEWWDWRHYFHFGDGPKDNTAAITNEVGPVTENVVPIHKGGNLWEAAKSLVTEKKINGKQFSEAWEHSTVKINGTDVPLSKVDLVHDGDQLQYIPESNGVGGHFDVVPKSGSPLGDEKALYDIYLNKHKEAPQWLKDAMGIKKSPGELSPEELMTRLKDLKPLEPAGIDMSAYVLNPTGAPKFIELPTGVKEMLAADDFRINLPKMFADIDTSHDHFGSLSLLQQEETLAQFSDFAAQSENFKRHAGELLMQESDQKMFEKTQKIYQELMHEFVDRQKDFSKVLNKMGVTEEMYKKGINKSGLTVGHLKEMFGVGTMDEKWIKFAKWVLEMKPKEEKDLVDVFVRGNFK